MKKITMILLLVLVSVALFSVEIPYYNSSPVTPDNTITTIPGCTPYIFYGKGSTSLREPLIFVEGLDLENENSWYWYYSELLNNHNLINDLRDEGYDLVFVNFTDSTKSMEENAESVISVINYVNEEKTSIQENAIVGASMGGVVSRYALTKMEHEGKDHDTRLFVSFDAPQQGAYIPAGIQAWIQLHKNFLGDDSPDDLKKIYNQLNRPACKELLYASLKTTNNQVIMDADKHEAFYKKLSDMGNYPKKLTKVAIANGSGHGNLQSNDISHNNKLFSTDLEVYHKQLLNMKVRDINLTIYEDTIPNNPTIPIQLNDTQTTQTQARSVWLILAGVVVVVGGIIAYNAVTDFESYTFWESGLHNAPGSYRATYAQIESNLANATLDDKDLSLKTSYNFKMPNHAFITTISALDLRDPEGEVLHPFTNIAADPDIKSKTVFNDIHWEDKNYDHMSISANAASFLKSHLANGRYEKFGKVMTTINNYLLED